MTSDLRNLYSVLDVPIFSPVVLFIVTAPVLYSIYVRDVKYATPFFFFFLQGLFNQIEYFMERMNIFRHIEETRLEHYELIMAHLRYIFSL